MNPAPAGVSAMQKRLSYFARRPRRTGRAGAADCLRERGEPDDRASSGQEPVKWRSVSRIGAGRWRLGRLVLVEAAIIGLIAAAAGWCFAQWSAPLVLARVNPPDNPARLSPGNRLARARIRCRPDSLRESALRRRAGAASLRDPAGRGAQRRRQLTRRVLAGCGSLIAVQAAFCFAVLFVAGLFVAHLRPFAWPAQRFFLRADRQYRYRQSKE